MTTGAVKDTDNDSSTITRELRGAVVGQETMDGAGVKLTRIIGGSEVDMLDPFLLLDAFESDQPGDYIGGFPDHPHRGFETVTYLLAGRMRHKDSAGHEGVIEPGGVQWMTAGRGIIHSEMPEQEHGLLMGFQLWVNLPRSAKMSMPAYQEFSADEIGVERWDSGTEIRVIAGRTNSGITGPVSNHFIDPVYMDIQLRAGDSLAQQLPFEHNAFLYMIEGEIHLGEQHRSVNSRTLALLSSGDQLRVRAIEDSRFLLVAGRPLKEPVVRAGPFVMNTQAEVLQAFEDFQNNRL